MKFVNDGFPFSFDYTNPLQNAGLKVAAKIYDVSSGSAVFVTTVAMTVNEFGSYSGNYTGQKDKTYLVACLVFTALDYATPDTQYAPLTYFYHIIGSSFTWIYWDYTAFDQADSLDIRSKIFNCSTGSPVLETQIVPTYVDYGVYFGRFAGALGGTYQVLSPVYQDGTYTDVDLTRAPVGESFQCVQFLSVNNTMGVAVLRGTGNSGKLRGVRNE